MEILQLVTRNLLTYNCFKSQCSFYKKSGLFLGIIYILLTLPIFSMQLMSVSDFSIIVQPPLQPDFQLTEILFIFDTIAQVSPLYYVSKLVKSLPTSHL